MLPEGSESARLDRIHAGYAASGRHARWSADNPGNRMILAEREAAMRALLHRHHRWPPARLDILEVGCGDGYNLGTLLGWGAEPARLHGIDLATERIALAKRRWPELDL